MGALFTDEAARRVEQSGEGTHARLLAVAACITPCSRLIDIGCDHGKLCKLVLDRRLALHVTACDISLPSLCKAKALLASDERADFVCADGAQALSGGYDTVVVSGLGGREIVRMIENAAGAHLVLQPQNAQSEVRQALVQNGYRITVDRVVYERGKFYDVLRAEKGESVPLTRVQCEWGVFYTRPSAVLKKKLERFRAKLESYPPTKENKNRLTLIAEVEKWQK